MCNDFVAYKLLLSSTFIFIMLCFSPSCSMNIFCQKRICPLKFKIQYLSMQSSKATQHVHMNLFSFLSLYPVFCFVFILLFHSEYMYEVYMIFMLFCCMLLYVNKNKRSLVIIEFLFSLTRPFFSFHFWNIIPFFVLVYAPLEWTTKVNKKKKYVQTKKKEKSM